MTESDPNISLTSIDHIGAFDHITRARILNELHADLELHNLLPFIRLWYSSESTFLWTDDNGISHRILQDDRGE